MRTASRVYETQQTDKTFVLELGDYDGTPAMLVWAVPPWCTRWMEPCVTLFWPPMGPDLLPQDVIFFFCWTGD